MLQTICNLNHEQFEEGFFYFFGFSENPIKEKVQQMISESPSFKVRKGILEVNTTLNKSFCQLQDTLKIEA